MNQPSMLIIGALAACALSVVFTSQRLVALIALLSCAFEAALHFSFIQMRVPHFPLSIVLSLCLAAAGALLWAGSSNKLLTSAATIIAGVGVLQLLATFVS